MNNKFVLPKNTYLLILGLQCLILKYQLHNRNNNNNVYDNWESLITRAVQ